ncbi:squamosa promoter-binding-like protein 13A [Punica granatum]|uniref:Squamosa promoter-binding-like protein 13A n=2 Tax=Punica granatum TaxID=22663 RepID=A0A6P8BSE0_PUNGR|nr:squamosa promoter-binding-like protein 13A [Punica granatum]XP_031373274.1 squamosa promoter-binding-like protein 13A [Punica granatum]XP_031373275.1 squamosa promoter-binding-like protein 13A [Punica granatum]OWM90601.1 hypothetical protein CDL15_Pgr014904 [Punica granatum]PKI43351.1 hypothetical protein CRG98_036247 [Punica granatum]
MDWNLKTPSWDFTEFAQDTLPNIGGVSGVSSSFGGNDPKGDFSVDLKLGQVSNPGNEPAAAKWKVGNIVSKKVSSPLGSIKRPRGNNNGAQVVSCLVDGCYADLSSCREYHRRHKVCELHSKTPEVTIGGHKQRFCQQCSRFHSMEEFDEGKRSCRKRLEGHNRRRRKPQPDPLIRPVNCLSNYQGTRLSPFSNSHVYPSAALGGNPAWVGVDNPSNAEGALYNQRHQQMPFLGIQSLLPGSSSGIYSGGGGKQFALLQGHQTAPETLSVSQPFHPRAIAISSESGSGSNGNNNMFCDGLLTLQVRDSDCALSLLSSPQMQTPGLGIAKPLGPPPRLLGGNLSQGLVPVDSVLVSSHGNETNIQCHGGIFMGHNGSPGDDHAPQTFPFQWD